MGRRYFGTDGVRGKVGESPITPEFVMHLGYAAGRIFSKGARGKPAVLLGKDTRISGYLLEARHCLPHTWPAPERGRGAQRLAQPL